MRSTPHYFLTKSCQCKFSLHIPHQLEKRNPNFKRFLSYQLPFKFALIFLWTGTVNTLLFFTNFTVFLSLSYFLLDAVHSHLWYILYNAFLIFDCLEQYGQVSEFYFLKSFVLSDFSFVSGLHFTGKPNLTNLSKSRKDAQIVYEISHNSNVLSWKHNTLEKLQLWLSLADDHF